MTTRRDFIKSGCAACVLMASGASLLESCATPLPLVNTTSTTSELQIGAENFISTKGNMLIVRTKQLENDILLIKNGETYKALLLRCTHEGVGLTPTANKIYCTSHGSVFDLDGRVQKEPALRPLKTYNTEVINNKIIIHLS
jgi:cytochrome b6-f complex iron-sulfur subunit